MARSSYEAVSILPLPRFCHPSDGVLCLHELDWLRATLTRNRALLDGIWRKQRREGVGLHMTGPDSNPSASKNVSYGGVTVPWRNWPERR